MNQRIRIILTLIGDDLSRKLNMDELSQLVNLSPSRLRHLFKAEIGMTPAQYQKFRRLEKAKELLETTFLSVKVIMNRVGMHNESHFTQDFKRDYGATPIQHRTLYHKAETVKDNRIG